jgi:DNA-binding SARP family transcriptional activator
VQTERLVSLPWRRWTNGPPLEAALFARTSQIVQLGGLIALTENSLITLTLLGRWQLQVQGEIVQVALRHQRVITRLALQGCQPRRHVAELLWPNATEGHASANLRGSVCSIRKCWPDLLISHHDALMLSPQVVVDVHELSDVIRDVETSQDEAVLRRHLAYLEEAELLPGWNESWLMGDQDRFRHFRLQTLDSLAERFLELGDTAEALEAARRAIVADPLRETSHSIHVQALALAGNHALALRECDLIRATLARELHIEPGPELRRLEKALMRKLSGPVD